MGWAEGSIAGGREQRAREGSKTFLSEEKNQKAFVTLSRPSQAAQTPEFAKVFYFFSTEKKTFLPYPPPR